MAVRERDAEGTFLERAALSALALRPLLFALAAASPVFAQGPASSPAELRQVLTIDKAVIVLLADGRQVRGEVQ